MKTLEVSRGPMGVECFPDPEALIQEEQRPLVERIERLEKIVQDLVERVKDLEL